jgi:hypothetical protein
MEEGLELGPHPPGEQVLLIVQRLHYIVYLLKVAAIWRRVWCLAAILLLRKPPPCPDPPIGGVPVEGGRHMEEGLELGPHPPGEQVLLLVQSLH